MKIIKKVAVIMILLSVFAVPVAAQSHYYSVAYTTGASKEIGQYNRSQVYQGTITSTSNNFNTNRYLVVYVKNAAGTIISPQIAMTYSSPNASLTYYSQPSIVRYWGNPSVAGVRSSGLITP